MFTTILSSVLVFGALIFFHELGHFLVAKRVGIHVKEFAIGFGPKVVSWTSKETDYSLRVFPLGGFVRMTGEDPEEKDEPGSFHKQSVFNRFAVIASGPLMNFLLAITLFFLIYFAFMGVAATPVQIGEVLSNGRAQEVGLQVGDTIVSINGEGVESWEQVVRTINAHPGEEIVLGIERDNTMQEIPVTPEADSETGRGLIGIGPKTVMYQFVPSLLLGVENTWMFLNFIFVSLLQMITGQIPADVAGPVGIVQIVSEVAQTGVINLLNLAAVLSINLGLINLLPIPALDGSRLVFLLIEGVRGKPVDPNKESFVHFVGFALLILLMVFIAYRDILRLDIF